LTVSISSAKALADAQYEHEDLIVGIDGTGTLAVEFAHFDEYHVLPPISGPRQGYLGEHPGFAHLEEDEPVEDFYVFGEGAEIHFEIVAFEGAFQIWDGLSGPYSAPGEQVLLGDDHLHKHVDWHINSADPGFDLGDSPWQAQFCLVDLGTTGYAASEVYTLSFVPEPGTAVVVALGWLAVAARRRR
jgi:hypothetical protein